MHRSISLKWERNIQFNGLTNRRRPDPRLPRAPARFAPTGTDATVQSRSAKSAKQPGSSPQAARQVDFPQARPGRTPGPPRDHPPRATHLLTAPTRLAALLCGEGKHTHPPPASLLSRFSTGSRPRTAWLAAIRRGQVVAVSLSVGWGMWASVGDAPMQTQAGRQGTWKPKVKRRV